MDVIGKDPKTYCNKENGCMFCDLLLCNESPKKEDIDHENADSGSVVVVRGRNNSKVN